MYIYSYCFYKYNEVPSSFNPAINLSIWGTVVILNFQFKINNGKKYPETIYTGNLIQDFLKGISHWESWIGYPNTTQPSRQNMTMLLNFNALIWNILSLIWIRRKHTGLGESKNNIFQEINIDFVFCIKRY